MPAKKKSIPTLNKIMAFVAIVIIVAFALSLPMVAGKLTPNDPGKLQMFAEYIYTGAIFLLVVLLAISFAASPLFLILFGLVAITMLYHFLRKIKIIKK